MADAAVLICAAFFAGMGLVALAQPGQVLAIFGVRALPPDARNEVRAVYGGFGVALAALLVWVVADDGPAREGVLIAAGVAMAGMAAGRVVGGAVEHPRGLYPVVFFFGVEVALAAALLLSA